MDQKGWFIVPLIKQCTQNAINCTVWSAAKVNFANLNCTWDEKILARGKRGAGILTVSFNRLIDQSINQSINQSNDRSIDQSINQPLF